MVPIRSPSGSTISKVERFTCPKTVLPCFPARITVTILRLRKMCSAADMPEQTWSSAWNGMAPKKSRICFVLGMDGARQKFRLDSDGGIFIRWNDKYMKDLPARDT